MKRCLVLIPVLVATSAGCSGGAGNPPKPQPRVPTGGVVRLDGKPLVGAVVVFLPLDSSGTLTQSDTDAEGRYALTYVNMPGGTSPGRYKVSVSYMVAKNGEPQGLGPRAALMPSPDFVSAQELLPTKYSDLGRSVLSATVPPEGGTFDFDLEGPLLTPSPPESDSPSPATPPGEAQGAEEPPPESKASDMPPAAAPSSQPETTPGDKTDSDRR